MYVDEICINTSPHMDTQYVQYNQLYCMLVPCTAVTMNYVILKKIIPTVLYLSMYPSVSVNYGWIKVKRGLTFLM